MKNRVVKGIVRMLVAVGAVVLLLGGVTLGYMQSATFGQSPSGERLDRIRQSPNYRDGQFQNLNPTPSLTEGSTYFQVLYEFLFTKTLDRYPADSIPSVKTGLRQLPLDQDVLVWFGHSSYYLQLDGKRLLVDPVFSGNASPVPGTNKAFIGTDRYTVDDLPEKDYLFISYDHYNHVDYETLVKLRPKTKKLICGLGVGAHFEHWGYAPADLIELDWQESVELDGGLLVHATPARHFPGRSLSRNNTLWLSFVVQTPTYNMCLGGDSGYDTHFAEIGQKFGPFDLAVLENGQYNARWKYVHLIDDEVSRAAQDLRAKKTFPVHAGKFALANHAWYEPFANVREQFRFASLSLLTPMIGEPVYLQDPDQVFSQWWREPK